MDRLPASVRREEEGYRLSTRGPSSRDTEDIIEVRGQPGGLRSPLDPLIGREAEVTAVDEMLARRDVRLVTLPGPSGVGKTRLAMQVAEIEAERQEAVCVVPLATIADCDGVFPAIAQRLGVALNDRPVLDSLSLSLKSQRLLLVLDNAEHLLAAGPYISELLTSCPNVKALVTSRATLGVRGEHVFPVPPLAMPERLASSTAVLHASNQPIRQEP